MTRRHLGDLELIATCSGQNDLESLIHAEEVLL